MSLGKGAGPDGPPSRQGRLGLMALFKSPSFCLGGGPLLFPAQRGAAAAANGPGGVQVDRRLCNVDAEPELGAGPPSLFYRAAWGVQGGCSGLFG